MVKQLGAVCRWAEGGVKGRRVQETEALVVGREGRAQGMQRTKDKTSGKQQRGFIVPHICHLPRSP